MNTFEVLNNGEVVWEGDGYGKAVKALDNECRMMMDDGWTIEQGWASRDNLSAFVATKGNVRRHVQIIRAEEED